MAIIAFIGAFALILLAYVGYPALIFLVSKLIGRPVRKAEITPKVSLIIAAFNEERDIRSKLENTLALDYPGDRLEIVVASDCSTDATNSIVRAFEKDGVILVDQRRRLGKTAAQNQAASIATGDIIIFSDATTIYERDAIRKMVRNFADPDVGCVSGNIIYVDQAATPVGHGMRSYWNYEFFLKQSESLCGGLIGVCGCLYAVRRTIYRPLAADMCSDFVIASDVRQQGLRVVYEPEAIARELTNNRSKDEFRMRVRIAEQTIRSLYRYREVLNPFEHGIYAFQMGAHKVLRYLAPPVLAVLFVSNLFSLDVPFLRLALGAQSAFYLIALAGWLMERLKIKHGLLGLPYYFVLSNAAILQGYIKFLRGESYVVWQPARGDALAYEAAEAHGAAKTLAGQE